MKLYNELAEWWHLLSSPNDYEEEANLYWSIIEKHKNNVQTALELGSGGGNNAFHLKKKCQFTLVDISPSMLKISESINPECIHHIGDMRKVNLNQVFDLVFIHDAIMLMTNEIDLKKVFSCAKIHLKKDGLLFIAPDFFQETFKPQTSKGGHDKLKKGIRYLEWTYDQNPNDNIVETHYAYLIKNNKEEPVCIHDKSIEGIFSKSTWKKLLTEVGFEVSFELIEHSELEPNSYFGIIGKLT